MANCLQIRFVRTGHPIMPGKEIQIGERPGWWTRREGRWLAETLVRLGEILYQIYYERGDSAKDLFLISVF